MEQVSEKLPESVVSLLPRLVARPDQRGPAVPGRAEPAGGAPPHLHSRHLLQVQEVIQQEVFTIHQVIFHYQQDNTAVERRVWFLSSLFITFLRQIKALDWAVCMFMWCRKNKSVVKCKSLMRKSKVIVSTTK